MNAIDIYIVYPGALFTQRFFYTLIEDTIEVLICWLFMRALILWLDKKLPLHKNFGYRVAVQLPLTILSTCGLLLLICELVQVLRHGKPVDRAVYTHHVWVYGIWLLGHNAIYITMYMWQWTQFVQKNKEMPAPELLATPDLPQPEKETLILRLGNKTRVVQFLDILYCTVSDNLTMICTAGHECLLAEKSLEHLDEVLPPDLFFRANRQFIIHRDLIVSTERIENGKIKLLVKPTPKLPDAIIISRTKAPAFKEWLKMAAA
ncbi:LytR/AlgR family response regulator transcription factor [Flavisolibacter tropicus]|uniref:HTH LytTR-type domain-containing protein n=1 Tax=Flavisolibacter tropicus TaxID=1492898 RepID=A0A172TY59_9BACT|nr:LytTR family DNA-binding domain-containing protein [Flavisolibacter tropicus]ANE52029.1 hypothetical protein SY85_17525 [Flavisolibacter tropicus]